MVIECTACHARFKLADEKVKPGGTKVRCSKCKEVFTVMPPAPPTPPPAAAEEEVDFGAFNMEPVAGASPDETTPSQQKPEMSAADQESPAGAGEAGRTAFTDEGEAAAGDAFSLGEAAATGAKTPAFGDEQPSARDDFSFTAAPDQEPEESAVGTGGSDAFAFGEEQAQATDDFAFGEEPAGGASGSDTGDELAFGDEESEAFAFGEEETPGTGDFDFGEESEESTFGSGESDEFAFGSEEESSATDDFGFEESESAGPVEFAFEEEEPSAEGGGTEFSWETEDSGDFGFEEERESSDEAEDLDFSGISFGEEESAPTPPLVAPAPETPQTASIATEAPRPPREFSPSETSATAAPQPPAIPTARRRKSPLKGVMFALLLLLLALLGGTVYLYWQGSVPELTRLVDQLTGQSTPPAAGGQIRLEGLSSFYVVNREAGQLLVIQGRAVNGYQEPRSSITVKGVVFDKAGKAVLQQTAFCGNPFDQEALKKLPFPKVEEGMNNPFGESLSNLNVAPGKAIPFTIVIRNLPADVSEFTVEVVDSKAGTKQ